MLTAIAYQHKLPPVVRLAISRCPKRDRALAYLRNVLRETTYRARRAHCLLRCVKKGQLWFEYKWTRERKGAHFVSFSESKLEDSRARVLRQMAHPVFFFFFHVNLNRCPSCAS